MPMVTTTCPACNRDFKCKAYRLSANKPHSPCCSISCARILLKAVGYKPWNTPKRKAAMVRARKLYERSGTKLVQIALQVGYSRGSVFAWARKEKWVPFARKFTARVRYRRAAVQKLRRRLKPYEQVHHVDGDIENNTSDNLHVYADAAAHSAAHKSLERCALELLKRGIIKFSQRTGKYSLA